MTNGESKITPPENDLLLDEALQRAREAVTLRSRLESVRREHAQLLAQREDSLSEGIDLLPKIKSLHFEIEKLPAEIARLEKRSRWLADQGVEKLNSENNQIAGQHYLRFRDRLRQLVGQFRQGLDSVQRDVEAGVELGPSLTDVYNAKLIEIDKLLDQVNLSRVTYRHLSLPPLDHELVRRNKLLTALDRWIEGLR